LLPFTKKEIYDFAENNNIQFREDVSNAKNDYLRNKIRNTILPELINVSARFLEGFAKSIHYLAESQGFVEENMERIFQEIVVQKDNAWFIKTSELQSQSDFIKYNILKKFGMDSLAEIEKIFSAKSGAVFHSFQFLLSIDRETIYIREKSNIEKLPTSEIILVNDFQELQSSNFSISLSKYFLDYEGGVSGETWLFDADKLIFPLLLRKKKIGDVFYPKGMIGKKKVSKFFKDEKIPILAKSKIWLLVDGSDTVLGVLPIRQDRRQTPDNESVNALKIIL
jgi:tRNA(Ile)-lysidine synthase